MTKTELDYTPLVMETNINTSLLRNEANKNMSVESLSGISPEKRNKHHVNTSHSIKLNLVPAQCCSAHLSAWKQQMGINAEVHHVLGPHCPPDMNDMTCRRNQDLVPMTPLSYAHLAAIPDENTIHPPPTASNREDILTQSQMLKTSDKHDFIHSQKAEIEGLEKFDVMNIHPMASLPRQAKVLSSIWSYQ
jgi:hypothetical protein